MKKYFQSLKSWFQILRYRLHRRHRTIAQIIFNDTCVVICPNCGRTFLARPWKRCVNVDELIALIQQRIEKHMSSWEKNQNPFTEGMLVAYNYTIDELIEPLAHVNKDNPTI